MPFKFSFSILFIVLISHAYAQKVWSLQECIDYALKNNIQIKQASLNERLAGNNNSQAKNNFIPTLNGTATHAYNFGQTIDRFTNQFVQGNAVQSNNFYLSSSITIFSGLKNVNTLKQTELNQLASKYDVEKAKNDIALNVASAYLQILFNKELLKIAENQLLLTEQQLQRTEKLFNAGATSKDNLLNVQAQKASEELSLVSAQSAVDISTLSLTQLLDLESANGFLIQDPEINIENIKAEDFNLSNVIKESLANRPEIKSQELRFNSSLKDIKIAYAGVSPTISFTGSIGTGYSGQRKDIDASSLKQTGQSVSGYVLIPDPSSGTTYTLPTYTPTYTYASSIVPFSKQFNQNVNKTLGFNMSVPILNNGQVRNNIQRAKINKTTSELNLQLAKNNLIKAVQQAFNDVVVAQRKYIASVKNVDANKTAFSYLEQKYNLGVTNSFDFNTSKNRLIKAEADLLQAKYDFLFKYKILEFYQGKPITLN